MEWYTYCIPPFPAIARYVPLMSNVKAFTLLLFSMVRVLKFLSLRKSHNLTSESSPAVAR